MAPEVEGTARGRDPRRTGLSGKAIKPAGVCKIAQQAVPRGFPPVSDSNAVSLTPTVTCRRIPVLNHLCARSERRYIWAKRDGEMGRAYLFISTVTLRFSPRSGSLPVARAFANS